MNDGKSTDGKKSRKKDKKDDSIKNEKKRRHTTGGDKVPTTPEKGSGDASSGGSSVVSSFRKYLVAGDVEQAVAYLSLRSRWNERDKYNKTPLHYCAFYGKGDLVAQFRQVCENLRTVVTAAGGQLTDIVKLTIYVLDADEYKRQGKAIGGVYREYFGRHFPAMTLVGARDLYDAADGCLIEIDGFACLA